MADTRHAFSTWHAALRRICGDFEAFPPLMNAFEGNVGRRPVPAWSWRESRPMPDVSPGVGCCQTARRIASVS